jgi:hypothetical protein
MIDAGLNVGAGDVICFGDVHLLLPFRDTERRQGEGDAVALYGPRSPT